MVMLFHPYSNAGWRNGWKAGKQGCWEVEDHCEPCSKLKAQSSIGKKKRYLECPAPGWWLKVALLRFFAPFWPSGIPASSLAGLLASSLASLLASWLPCLLASRLPSAYASHSAA